MWKCCTNFGNFRAKSTQHFQCSETFEAAEIQQNLHHKAAFQFRCVFFTGCGLSFIFVLCGYACVLAASCLKFTIIVDSMPRFVMQVAMAAAAVRAAADAAKVCKKSICGDDIHALIQLQRIIHTCTHSSPICPCKKNEQRFLFAMKHRISG